MFQHLCALWVQLRHVQHPLYQPMVVRPLPWLGVNFGAYLYAPSRIMRTKGNQEQIRVLQEADTNPDSGISQVENSILSPNPTLFFYSSCSVETSIKGQSIFSCNVRFEVHCKGQNCL